MIDCSKLLSAVAAPLERLLQVLKGRWSEIDRRWCELMVEYGMELDTIDRMRALTLGHHRSRLSSRRWEAYENRIEEDSRQMERSGQSLESSVAAVAFYGECCRNSLSGADAGRDERWALDRWVSATQLLVIRGYAQQKAASWRKLDERERQRLSRDLHDEIGHNLVVLKLYLEMIAGDLGGQVDPETVRRKIQEATDLVGQSVESVRRLMLDLGPAVLEEVGLVRGLRIYAADFTKRTRIQVRVQTRTVPANLSSSIETALYRVYQGALSNVAKHSGADHVEVRIRGRRQSVRMVIEDDGVGFDAAMRGSQRTFGLTAMRERVELLGGELAVDSSPSTSKSAPHGTRIEVVLPLEAADTGKAK